MKQYEALILFAFFLLAMPVWYRLVKALAYNSLAFFIQPGYPVTVITPAGKTVSLSLPSVVDLVEFKENPNRYIKSHNIDLEAM